jgi:hypothetical protein
MDYVVEHSMNTNPGTGVNTNIPNSISNFFSSATGAVTDGKALNYSIHTGAFDIPYATMGLVTIIAGTFTYITYTDYKNDPGDDEDEDNDEDENEDENDDLGMFNSLNYNSNTEEAETTEPEEAETTEPEEAETKKPEEAETKEPEEAETKNKEEAEKKDKEEAPGEKYTLGGKPYSRKKKRTKRKYTKRKSPR